MSHGTTEWEFNEMAAEREAREVVHSTCQNCNFFEYQNPGGECRRAPPVRLPRRFDPTATAGSRVRSEQLLWGWPEVRSEDWCGEFRAVGQ